MEDESEMSEQEERDYERDDSDALYDQMVDDDFDRLRLLLEGVVVELRKKSEARPWFGYYNHRDEAKVWEDAMVVCDSKLEQLEGQLPVQLIRRRDLRE